ncbi:MAG: hypothetical protein IPL19_22765 [Sandaracinaceae bacterium]|nr:hypothetical protein [Sandaracinaceae bacterium]MBK7774692.1 hypothetical protein [Sandaracinaceae bacterium]MBK8410779.1 hypothetical protein [Sandaracinaceae bacterium]
MTPERLERICQAEYRAHDACVDRQEAHAAEAQRQRASEHASAARRYLEEAQGLRALANLEGAEAALQRGDGDARNAGEASASLRASFQAERELVAETVVRGALERARAAAVVHDLETQIRSLEEVVGIMSRTGSAQAELSTVFADYEESALERAIELANEAAATQRWDGAVEALIWTSRVTFLKSRPSALFAGRLRETGMRVHQAALDACIEAAAQGRLDALPALERTVTAIEESVRPDSAFRAEMTRHRLETNDQLRRLEMEGRLTEARAYREAGNLAGAQASLSLAEEAVGRMGATSADRVRIVREEEAIRRAGLEPLLVTARQLERQGEYRSALNLYLEVGALQEARAGIQRIEDRRRFPRRARRFSLVLPAGGQFYARRPGAGLAVLAGYVGSAIGTAFLLRASTNENERYEHFLTTGESSAAGRAHLRSRRLYRAGMGFVGGIGITWFISFSTAGGMARQYNVEVLGLP